MAQRVVSISIMELTDGRCACLVPEEPYPRYCGGKVVAKFRMCRHHAKAYLAKEVNNEANAPNAAAFTRISRGPRGK